MYPLLSPLSALPLFTIWIFQHLPTGKVGVAPEPNCGAPRSENIPPEPRIRWLPHRKKTHCTWLCRNLSKPPKIHAVLWKLTNFPQKWFSDIEWHWMAIKAIKAIKAIDWLHYPRFPDSGGKISLQLALPGIRRCPYDLTSSFFGEFPICENSCWWYSKRLYNSKKFQVSWNLHSIPICPSYLFNFIHIFAEKKCSVFFRWLLAHRNLLEDFSRPRT